MVMYKFDHTCELWRGYWADLDNFDKTFAWQLQHFYLFEAQLRYLCLFPRQLNFLFYAWQSWYISLFEKQLRDFCSFARKKGSFCLFAKHFRDLFVFARQLRHILCIQDSWEMPPASDVPLPRRGVDFPASWRLQQPGRFHNTSSCLSTHASIGNNWNRRLKRNSWPQRHHSFIEVESPTLYADVIFGTRLHIISCQWGLARVTP